MQQNPQEITAGLIAPHFAAFGRFLQPADLPESAKKAARDKLGRLSNSQFFELSTDVYDELSRRESRSDPFLAVNGLYHPKRNQARQKLATLSISRFKELASDVYLETERRFSGLTDAQLDNSNIFNANQTTSLANNPNASQSSLRLQNGPVMKHNLNSLDNLMKDLVNVDNGGQQNSSLDRQQMNDMNNANSRNNQERNDISMNSNNSQQRNEISTLNSNNSTSSINNTQMNESSVYNSLNMPRKQDQMVELSLMQGSTPKLLTNPRKTEMNSTGNPTSQKFQNKISNNNNNQKLHNQSSKTDLSLQNSNIDNQNCQNQNAESSIKGQDLSYQVNNLKMELEVSLILHQRQSVSALEQQRDSAKRLEYSQNMASKLQSQCVQIEEKYQLLQQDFNNLQEDIKEKELDIKSLSLQNGHLKAKEQENVVHVHTLEKTLESLENTVDDLEFENKTLRQQHESLVALQIQDASKIEMLQNTIASLRKELGNQQTLPRIPIAPSNSYKGERSVIPDVSIRSLSPSKKNTSQRNEVYSDISQNANTKDLSSKNDSGALYVPETKFDRKGSTSTAASSKKGIDTTKMTASSLSMDAYVQAVEDLIDSSRTFKPSNVLVGMKAVVIACKNLVENVETIENEQQFSFKDHLDQCKMDLSTGLTRLMNLAKEHATKNNPTRTHPPLEESAHELTDIVQKLLDVVNNLELSSNVTAPMDGDDAYHISELKIFLENQTDLIVQSIQALLYSMRQASPYGSQFQAVIGEITSIVSLVAQKSFQTLSRSSALSIRDDGEIILNDLTTSNETLKELGNEIVDNPDSKNIKPRLAACSYEIAKFVKALISLLES